MNKLSALFPLIVAALLAGAAVWLEYVVRSEGGDRIVVSRHEPDAIVDNFQVMRYSPSGVLQYQLDAEKLLHFPDDDSSELTQPRIRFVGTERPSDWSSQKGYVTDKTRKIVLSGDVIGRQPAVQDRPAQTLTTDELTILTEDEIAQTDKPMTIVREGSRLFARGGGQWDNINGLLQLNQVEARLPPNQP